jgi:hypothetical protein
MSDDQRLPRASRFITFSVCMGVFTVGWLARRRELDG